MPTADAEKTRAFASAQDLSAWLALNHATERELWVKIFRKHTGIASVSWDDVVIESLCWGWIDGVKKSLDEQSYLQRITPRKPRSSWSKRNREHVERLISEQRMQEAGLVHVRAAQADGRWQNAYTASEAEVPADFIAALDALPQAQAFYATLSKSARFVIAHGLTSAKRPETRQKRFEKYLDMLCNQQKPN